MGGFLEKKEEFLKQEMEEMSTVVNDIMDSVIKQSSLAKLELEKEIKELKGTKIAKKADLEETLVNCEKADNVVKEFANCVRTS